MTPEVKATMAALERELRLNPFCDRGKWYWRDEAEVSSGPYGSQMDALRALLRHCDKRGRWAKFKDLLVEVWRA